MNVLIVHAHHEPLSFSSALKNRAVDVLTRQGHEVQISDLYEMRFDPVSGRHNFITVRDPAYLKQQEEELHASEKDGFAPELDEEMSKLERADLLIFSFPMWWFSMPAILKGWVDRVFVMGRVYGNGKLYDGGTGRGKRAMIIMTAGGPLTMYDGYGINPSLASILQPVEHGIFAFNGFAPLPALVVHRPARMSAEERANELDRLEHHLSRLDELAPMAIASVDQFEGLTGSERGCRFMVELRAAPGFVLDESKLASLEELRRRGKLLTVSAAEMEESTWIAWLLIRERSRAAVEALLAKFGPASMQYTIWQTSRLPFA